MNNGNLAYEMEYREELIDGKIVAMSPRPGWNHISIAANIYNLFANYLHGKKCTAIPDGCDLFLTKEDRFVPFWWGSAPGHNNKPAGAPGARARGGADPSPPPAKHDRFRKKNVYQLCGVREYWIADPANRMVEQYFLVDGVLQLNAIYAVYRDWEIRQMTEEERAAMVTRFNSSLIDDFEIALEDIFTGLLPDAE